MVRINIKNIILGSITAAIIFLTGCGGGGSGGSDINITALVVGKTFYRVADKDVEIYTKRDFSSSGKLIVEYRDYDDFLESNETWTYEIQSTSLSITDESNQTWNCDVKDDNNESIIFACLKEGWSGIKTPEKWWKFLGLAKQNPES